MSREARTRHCSYRNKKQKSSSCSTYLKMISQTPPVTLTYLTGNTSISAPLWRSADFKSAPFKSRQKPRRQLRALLCNRKIVVCHSLSSHQNKRIHNDGCLLGRRQRSGQGTLQIREHKRARRQGHFGSDLLHREHQRGTETR